MAPGDKFRQRGAQPGAERLAAQPVLVPVDIHFVTDRLRQLCGFHAVRIAGVENHGAKQITQHAFFLRRKHRISPLRAHCAEQIENQRTNIGCVSRCCDGNDHGYLGRIRQKALYYNLQAAARTKAPEISTFHVFCVREARLGWGHAEAETSIMAIDLGRKLHDITKETSPRLCRVAMPRDVVMPLITVYSNRQRNQSFRAEAFAAGPDSNRAKIHCFHEAALTEREKGGHPAKNGAFAGRPVTGWSPFYRQYTRKNQQ